jgi:hypothetical protein
MLSSSTTKFLFSKKEAREMAHRCAEGGERTVYYKATSMWWCVQVCRIKE